MDAPRPPVGRGYRRPGRAVVGAGGACHAAPCRSRPHGAARRRDGAHPSTVSPAHAPLVVFTASLTAGAGDTVRAAPRAPETHRAARMEERSLPAGGNIMVVMFSEGQARGLRPSDSEHFITPWS
jgi:hypothetical protein